MAIPLRAGMLDPVRATQSKKVILTLELSWSFKAGSFRRGCIGIGEAKGIRVVLMEGW